MCRGIHISLGIFICEGGYTYRQHTRTTVRPEHIKDQHSSITTLPVAIVFGLETSMGHYLLFMAQKRLWVIIYCFWLINVCGSLSIVFGLETCVGHYLLFLAHKRV